MKALVLTTATREVSVKEIAKPTPKSNELLIRVHAVALNPVDYLYAANPTAAQEQRVVGTDFAGVVVAVGEGLKGLSEDDPRTKVGARVAGFLQGACSTNDRPGAFAEFITAEWDLVWAVPDSLSLEEASAVSMCGLTAAQAVFTRLGLPSPFQPADTDLVERDLPHHSGRINVLIYGASTSLGLYAAQIVRAAERTLKKSGHEQTSIRLIGVASKGKHGLLRDAPYGYDVLVDYRDDGWVEKVRGEEGTGGEGVHRALDCISEGTTLEKIDATLTEGAKLSVVRGPARGGYDVSKLRTKPVYGAVWEGLGVEIGYLGTTFPANPNSRAMAARFFEWLSQGAETGTALLQPNPIRIMPGGLERIPQDGFALLASPLVSQRGATGGRKEEYMRPISGEKLVYRIE